MPFYSGLTSPLLSLIPTATRGEGGGNSGNIGNIITGFIFDREITTRDILIRDFAFYSC